MRITWDINMKQSYLLLLMLLLFGCSTPEYLSEDELTSYISDESNGLSASKERNGVMVKVNYRPKDFLIWQEVQGESDPEKVKKAMEKYEDHFYFIAQLSAGEKDALYGTSSDQVEFSEKLQTLSFRMNQFVNLTTSNQDTIPVADFYYSRMFGMSGSSDILFVFSEEKAKDTEWVSFNMKEFGFKTGVMRFRFDTRTIAQAPKLNELATIYESIEQ